MNRSRTKDVLRYTSRRLRSGLKSDSQIESHELTFLIRKMVRKFCDARIVVLVSFLVGILTLTLSIGETNGQQQINDNVQRPILRRQQAVQIDDDEDEVAPARPMPHAGRPTEPQNPPQPATQLKPDAAPSKINSAIKTIMLTTVVGSIILPPALRVYGPKLVEEARVTLDDGRYVGFLRDNFEFSIPGVEPGSYLVEVDFPALLFQPLRVDVNSKGKARSRQVDLQMVRTNEELKAPYPMKVYALDRAPYFAKREQWRITDVFMNPMVLMMLVPAALMYLVPKMQQNIDPEAQQEMARLQGQSPMDMMSNLLGGGSSGSNSGSGSKPAIKSSGENSGGTGKQGTNGDERERRKRRDKL